MLISAAPVALPISTANPPTEQVASEAAHRAPIPKPPATADNPSTKNSTEFAEQNRGQAEVNRGAEQRDTIEGNREQSNGQNQEQSDREFAGKNSSGDEKNEEAQEKRLERQREIQEKAEIQELKARDREVRAHETAHAAVGGQLAGAPSLEFKTGPDGRRYAVSGEVSIDTSKVANNPQATVDKMRQVRQAALAPANPSPQDLKVAAIASQLANQALVELNLERNQESNFQVDQEKGNPLEGREIRFVNPVAARRSSLNLRSKLLASGAFEEVDKAPLFSQRA
ncbi:putative metalloprotease CJM1_0395 family protein [Aliikangiella sp. G2MR2-5]|uniref:putative metalloprotease CJM1_0395 family protein n=1 Tax=Aliikangiella sp. G2MR2-5 TaxID=2788943 RepID=UPI0018A97775|nr:putative metalloprotease CJM1_0395 family protein [Aliikangiella sp. G2MR2-5]